MRFLQPMFMRDNWRWHLDPRDPDYLEPPSKKDVDAIEESAIDILLEDRLENKAAT